MRTLFWIIQVKMEKHDQLQRIREMVERKGLSMALLALKEEEEHHKPRNVGGF